MRHSPWLEVGDRVFVRRYEFLSQNVGVVLTEDGALVIDTRATPALAREVQSDLRVFGGVVVSAVVNTHGHWDHFFGNAAFPGVPVWGHEQCSRFVIRNLDAMKSRAVDVAPWLASALHGVSVTPPTNTVRSREVISSGSREIELLHLGRGHTDHDIVIRVVDAGVIFVGDLLVGVDNPYFADSYPLDWPSTVDNVLALHPRLLVSGHGDITDRSRVHEQRRAFVALADLARRIERGDLSTGAALALHPFPSMAPADKRASLERAVAQSQGLLG
jgi:glyoxylase-like metal-dependent hydrolase (beta-lactamase superfamily II)